MMHNFRKILKYFFLPVVLFLTVFFVNNLEKLSFNNVSLLADLAYIISTGSGNSGGDSASLDNDPSLVAYFKFDGLNGTKEKDYSVFKNDFNFSKAIYESGINGKAVNLMGSFGFIPHTDSLSMDKELTLSFWLYPRSLPNTYSSILDKTDDKNKGPTFTNYATYLWGNSESPEGRGLSFWGGVNNATWGALTAIAPVKLNTWQHIALTFKNNVGGKIYINGAVDYRDNAIRGVLSQNTGDIKIGGDGANVLIDELKIFNRALNNNEIQNLAHQHKKLLIVPLGYRTVTVGNSISFQVSANCLPTCSSGLRYEVSPIPKGAFFNSDTGLFTWTPDASQLGLNTLNFTVKSSDLSDSTYVDIFVKDRVTTSNPGPTNVSDKIVVHVALNGNDNNNGSVNSPLATILKAVSLIDKENVSGEIIIHKGVYKVPEVEILPAESYYPGKTFNENRTLLIRANTGDEVVFDGSVPLSSLNPKPLSGYPGVYTISGDFMVDVTKGEMRPPDIWEDSGAVKVRYKQVKTLEALRSEDYTSVLIDRNTVGIHGSGNSFDSKKIMVSDVRTAIRIRRPNVTISGINFKNHMGHRWANSVSLLSYNNILENCKIYNSYNGVLIGNIVESKPNQVNNCEILDTGTGVYVNYGGGAVLNSTIINTGGKFVIYEIEQENRSGVMFYSPSTRGIVRGNLIKGFANNCIRKKTSPGEFIFEHNTLIDCEEAGIASRYWADKDKIKYNIIYNSGDSILPQSTLTSKMVIDKNIFWHTDKTHQVAIQNRINELKPYGNDNKMIDPQFVSPNEGKYTLLPLSLAVSLSDDGKPVGAFGVDSSQSANVPNLVINMKEDGTSSMKDPSNPKQYITKVKDIDINLYASALYPITNVKIRVEGDKDKEKPFQVFDGITKLISVSQKESYIGSFHSAEKIALPDVNQTYTVSISVQDSKKKWSEEESFKVTLSSNAPVLLKREIYANKYRVLMYFETGRKTTGTFRYYKKGKENISTIGESGSTAAGMVVEPNSDYTYRLFLTDALGNKATYEGSFSTNASPKVMYVSPEGQDLEENGDKTKPFKTLNFAARRLLPGDTLFLESGNYFEPMELKWGGIAGHPITIESIVPGGATIDGLKKYDRGIYMVSSPYTILKNIRVQWFNKVLISVGSSPNTIVTNCYLENSSSDGTINDVDGITLSGSDNSQVDHCIIKGVGTALQISSSKDVGVFNNTFISSRSFIYLLEPFDKIKIQYNLFFAAMIQAFSSNMATADRLKSLDMDYNNYAGRIRKNDPDPPDTFIELPKPFNSSESKHHVLVLGKEFDRLDRWQDFSGQDKHSIVATPLFKNPMTGDFSLQQNSPNILSSGKIIGAIGYSDNSTNQMPPIKEPAGGGSSQGGAVPSTSTSDIRKNTPSTVNNNTNNTNNATKTSVDIVSSADFDFVKTVLTHNNDLKTGDRGKDISSIKTFLKTRNYLDTKEGDDIYDEKTAKAVEAFQNKFGIEGDIPGEVGSSTKKILKSILDEISLSSDKITFSKPLVLGDKGEEILKLRRVLVREGFLDLVDIYTETFDDKLLQVVKDFQIHHNLAKEGVPGFGDIGPKTREVLNTLSKLETFGIETQKKITVESLYGISKSLYKGIRDDEVRILQRFLIDKKYLGLSTTTNYFGPITQNALIKFQIDRKIITSPEDFGAGLVGPKTRIEINK